MDSSQGFRSRSSSWADQTSASAVVIGGGIVGLSTAYHLSLAGVTDVIVVEKEQHLAGHQTGNNSGVIHSGLYYKPGSLKATMAKAGAQSMVAFCQQHDIRHEVTGKLVVATKPQEIPLLDRLYQRGLENGIPVHRITPAHAREHEPHVSCVDAMWVETTGIADYKAVCQTFAETIEHRGGHVRLGTKVTAMARIGQRQRVSTTRGDIEAVYVINCAGLYSDRITRLGGADPTAQIVPFRGEYYELAPHRRHLVKGLIYPVPNPDFPFLGVHFTRMIDGSVHAGPNAVLAFQREGYNKTDVDLKELGEILRYRGFHKLAKKNWREGAREMWRSVSRAAFVKSLQELIPEVTDKDVVPTHAGVRAQALQPDGSMVDDFLLVEAAGALHVCNAPSPAATASLEIGTALAQRVRAAAPHLFTTINPQSEVGAST
jgi:(S)-2-hydroxyglutarate dehydrogenase